MPLVPLTTVQRWYKRDSWVYKGFSYWFQNPLWNTSIPKGFSLCPYFWMSIFSIFLRIFVGAVFLIRLVFKPFGGLLTLTDTISSKFVGNRRGKGIPTTLGVLITACITVVGYAITKGISIVHGAYAEAGVLWTLYTPLGLLLVFLPCLMYAESKRHVKDRCKVENYTYLACFIATFLGAWWGGWEFISSFWRYPWLLISGIWNEVICVAAGGIWWFICSIPGFFIDAFAWIFQQIGTFFITFTLPVLYVVGVMLILGVVGLLLDKIYLKSPARIEDKEVEARVDSIIDIMARNTIWSDNDLPGERNKNYWKKYIRFVPEAVALAYDIARRKETPTEDELKRASAAAIATLKAEMEYIKERERIRNEQCKAITKRTEKVVKPLGRGVALPFIGLWWLLKQLWTFLCLLWELIKAKKSGACPYLKFEDPQASKPSIVVNDKELARTTTPSCSG